MSGKGEKSEKRERPKERKPSKSSSQKSDQSISSSASNAVASTISEIGTSLDSLGGTNSPVPRSEPSDLSRSISPRTKKQKKISQSSINMDGSPMLREKLNSRSSSAGPSSGSASFESSSSPAPPFYMGFRSNRTGSHDHFGSGTNQQLFAVPSSPSGRTNLYNGNNGPALQENGEEAELIQTMWRDFQAQISPAVTNLVKRNRELRSHVSILLKAATVEEAPYFAIAREKETLSREYDALRYEHLALQNEFLTLRKDHMEATAIAQRLQCELDLLRANQGTASSGGQQLQNSQNLSTSNFSIPQGSSTSMTSSQGSSTSSSSYTSSTPRSSTNVGNGNHIVATAVYGVSSPYAHSYPAAYGGGASSESHLDSATAPEYPLAAPDSNFSSHSSPSLISSSGGVPSPRLQIKRKDNVAELEQSILELEEEIRSPRSMASPEPSETGRKTRRSRESSTERSTKSKGDGRSSPPREHTPSSSSASIVTSKSKRKVPKSHSNDPPNTHSINSANGASTPNGSSPAPGSTRVKAPPERNISAPSNHSKSSVVSSNTTAGSPSGSRSDKPHSTSSAPSTASHISSPASLFSGIVAKDAIASQNLGSGSNNSSPRLLSPEDREEQRLAKYMGGYGAVRRTASKQSASARSSGPVAPGVTSAEQTAFTLLFKEYDKNDDGVIERSEFEQAAEAMHNYESLKELAAVVLPQLAKVQWEASGLGSTAPVTLMSALTFLSDCKTGHASASVFQLK